MNKQDLSQELTLPTAVSTLRGRYQSEELLLTIIFHSDPSRIGETAALPGGSERQPLVLGRNDPLFISASADGSGRPLHDPHISRVALKLHWQGGLLHLGPGERARVRVDGRALSGAVALTSEQLRRGLPLMLGHAVVLCLHLGAPALPQATAEATAGILGGSAYAVALRQQLLDVAASEQDVLVLGETGTGKELVAEAIHAASRRHAGPLVAVNMAAIPESLAPAALFGNARGAFTGADRARSGFFQQAEAGTLFLDEVGDTAVSIQPQLLRALEQREIQVLGGPSRKVDVRVISATDARLEGEGSDFRAALRHRLGVLEVPLLPLSQHPQDIGELLWHFLQREFQSQGRAALLPNAHSSPRQIASWADLFYRCLCYHWPGNVRELINRAAQVAVASRDELTLPRGLYERLQHPAEREHDGECGGERESGQQQPEPGQAPPADKAPLRPMKEVSAESFRAVWEQAHYGITAIAKSLGVSRQSVSRRIEGTRGMRAARDIPEQEIGAMLVQTSGDLAAAALCLQVSAAALRSRALHLGLIARSSGGD